MSGKSYFFSFQRKFGIFFSVSSLINFEIVYVWPMYQSLDKRISFTNFFNLKQSCILFQILIVFFVKLSFILLQLKAWLFEKFVFELKDSYSFKKTYIVVRQVISLKKDCGVINSFMVSYLYSFNTCISINGNGK